MIREIIKLGKISQKNTDLTTFTYFSAIVAFEKRTRHYGLNSSKLEKAKQFIEHISKNYLEQGKVKINSIDELVNINKESLCMLLTHLQSITTYIMIQ